MGDEPEGPAPASECPNSEIRVQSHSVELAAARGRENKTRLKIHFVHSELDLPDTECPSR